MIDNWRTSCKIERNNFVQLVCQPFIRSTKKDRNQKQKDSHTYSFETFDTATRLDEDLLEYVEDKTHHNRWNQQPLIDTRSDDDNSHQEQTNCQNVQHTDRQEPIHRSNVLRESTTKGKIVHPARHWKFIPQWKF